MRAVPARAKRVVDDTVVLVTLPAAEVIENDRPVGVVPVSTRIRVSPSTLAMTWVSAESTLIMAARPAATSESGTASRTTCVCVLVPRFTVTVSPALGVPLIATAPPLIAVAAPVAPFLAVMEKVAGSRTTMPSPRPAAVSPELSMIFCASAAMTSASVSTRRPAVARSPSASTSPTTWLNVPAPVTARQVSPTTGTPRATPMVDAVACVEAVLATERATA